MLKDSFDADKISQKSINVSEGADFWAMLSEFVRCMLHHSDDV